MYRFCIYPITMYLYFIFVMTSGGGDGGDNTGGDGGGVSLTW